MKKITFLTTFLLLSLWTHAQFSCGSGVPLTNGFTASGITTPGNGGPENWVSSVNTNNGANVGYWTDDVYLFQYTAGATDESITIKTFSRKSWNGLGIFTVCDGTTLSGALASAGNTGSNSSKTLTATISAGQTVYIATGQWGTPNALDFDVTEFTVVQLVDPPNCTTLSSPANGASDVTLTSALTWTAATGSPTGYKLNVGTTSGGTDVLNGFNVGNVLTYNIPGVYNESTVYYVTVIPFNGNGNAIGCEERSFTTAAMPAEGNLCENPHVIGGLPFNAVDNTSNYANTYVGAPGTSGCGTTDGYLGGNDVVYSYTATFTGTIKIVMEPGGTWSGLFIYGSCNNIGTSCLGGISNSSSGVRTISEFPVTSGQTYYFVISTWPSPQSIPYTLNITENTCINGTATYTVVSDCLNGNEQFFVAVNVTSLGSATSVSISDNVGSNPVSVSATGITSMGPYSNGTPVTFTVTNDQDSSCFWSSSALNQAICPPNCSTAEVIANCGLEINASLAAGSGTWNVAACGFSTPGTEKVYSFTPTETGAYSLEIISATGGYIDYFYKAASGSCDTTGWTCIDDNNGAGIDPIGTLTAGVQYLILLDSEDTAAKTSNFKIKCPPTCTNGTATYTVVSGCSDGNEQFNVEVAITNMGTATSYLVTDNQGSASQQVTAIGTVVFGPYALSTSVVFTVANEQDATCVLTSPARTLTVCPPGNDNIADAYPISCGAPTYTGSTVFATLDQNNAPDFGEILMDSPNVWYSYTGSGTPEKVTLNLCTSLYDTAVFVYTGTPGNLSIVIANDDAGAVCGVGSELRSRVSFNSDGVTTYYITIEGYLGGTGTYNMNVTCADIIPPAFENQTCLTALPVPVDGTDTLSDNSYGDVTAAQPSCDLFGSIQDVWFSFVAPAQGAVSVSVTNATMLSGNFNVYSGSCGALTAVTNACTADFTTSANKSLTGLTASNTYYVQVWSGESDQGSFALKVLDTNLSVDNPNFSGFNYYPNPVKNELHLNNIQNISNVAIYNIVGQQVIAKAINASQSKIDMSHLAAGTYIVKVTSENQTKTLKVVKQ